MTDFPPPPPDSTSEPSSLDPDSLGRIDEAMVDLGRASRCGFGEVIYGEGKSADLIRRIVLTQHQAGQPSLVTRIDPDLAAEIVCDFPHWHINPSARTLRVDVTPRRDRSSRQTLLPQPSEAHVAVVSAGSTDGPVAEEAMETLAWMEIPATRFTDIGVAGPQRLSATLPELRKAAAIVVVAGMEGALPSVIGGHVSVPLFAVPTSVGYGANLGGITALLGMLTSCAAGVAVVNIDAGFKGAYLAGMIVAAIRNAQKEGEARHA